MDLSENINALIQMQRYDGGYGLKSDYESDIYDTTLALDCLLNVTEKDEEISKVIEYLIQMQREDGGWSYDNESTDTELTVKIATLLCKSKYDYDIRREKLDSTIAKASEYINKNCIIVCLIFMMIIYYIQMQFNLNS